MRIPSHHKQRNSSPARTIDQTGGAFSISPNRPMTMAATANVPEPSNVQRLSLGLRGTIQPAMNATMKVTTVSNARTFASLLSSEMLLRS